MAEGSRILIVDDEPGIRQVINTNLVMQGYETLEAKNGRQCLDILAEDPNIDLVILDVMMPGTNGWEVLESMREQPEMAGISVMLLTAVSTEESKVRGFELGAADYLVKPFAIGELLARVQRILSEKQEREALAEFSITDWVTGLFNRRYLELRLGQEIARSLRYDSALSGIFFDVDQLPAINEHEGPKLIDALLGQLATLLRGQIRACDLVFRYDGDFFFLLLPDTDGVGAFEVAERIRRTIDSATWAENKQLTASIGVVEHTQGESPDSFMSRAEEALHRAKALGGDATWSAFAQAGGKTSATGPAVGPLTAPKAAVEPLSAPEPEPSASTAPESVNALDDVALSNQPLSQVPDPLIPDDAQPEYFEPAAPEVDAPQNVEPQPTVEPPSQVSIPLPTAQTQVMKTADLAALRESLTDTASPETDPHTTQVAPINQAPPATEPVPTVEPQTQVQHTRPTQPVLGQQANAYPAAGAASGWGAQQPPANPVQQGSEHLAAPDHPTATGPSSWADAQMMAATQFAAPPLAEPVSKPTETPPEQSQPENPTYPPEQQPRQ